MELLRQRPRRAKSGDSREPRSGRDTFFRFVIAGLANTAFGFFVYTLCILAGLPLLAALLLGNVLGLLFNFLTLGAYAFRDLSRKRLPRFIAAYVALLGVNWLLIRIATDITSLGLIAAQALLTVPLALASFLVMNAWVFQRRESTL